MPIIVNEQRRAHTPNMIQIKQKFTLTCTHLKNTCSYPYAASTVASPLTMILKLPDFRKPRTKRFVNAFIKMSVLPPHIHPNKQALLSKKNTQIYINLYTFTKYLIMYVGDIVDSIYNACQRYAYPFFSFLFSSSQSFVFSVFSLPLSCKTNF